MKKTLPIALGVMVGFYALAEFYVPHWKVRWLTTEFQTWAAIIGAFAFILGGVNLIQVNYPKIRRRERDWQYKVVMVAAAAVMLLAGLKWQKVLGTGEAGTYAITPTGAPAGKALVRVNAPDDVMVQAGPVQGPAVQRGAYASPQFEAVVDPGPVSIKVYRRVGGYEDYTADVTLAAGAVVTVTADPPMMWGTRGRVYVWLYEHVFAPCNATMFALLAFFVVSAAFRAFRMRNVEATLLLVSAIIVMLGTAPIGAWISDDLPEIKQWILDIPNNGGRRAIMMGAAIGAIATSLRIILGLERSHLGSE
ncbi:MAG: hypothetical protein K8W52_31335 [Deltaproteobacteria bacterium]|nr:hypothetical protein [Deltaproteobacteria bacterium]